MTRQLVIFQLAGRRLGLDLFAALRVTRAVEITPLPHASPGVAGVINVQGQVLPVIDLKKQLRFEEPGEAAREVRLSDQFIITRAGLSQSSSPSSRSLALWVERVEGVVECVPADWVTLDEVLNASAALRRFFSGAVKLDGEIILVCDPAVLLTSDEVGLLDDVVFETKSLIPESLETEPVAS